MADNCNATDKSETEDIYEFAFIRAVKERNIHITKVCVDAGVNINYKKSKALMTSVKNHDYDMVEFLLESGIDVSAQNNLALFLSTFYDLGSTKIYNLLINYGADVTANNNEAICYYTEVMPSNPGRLDIIIKDGANVTARNNLPIWNIVSGYNDWTDQTSISLRLLLDNGADVNFYQGKSLLNKCVEQGYIEGCKILLAYGALPDLDQINKIIRDMFDEWGLSSIVEESAKLFMDYGLDFTDILDPQ